MLYSEVRVRPFYRGNWPGIWKVYYKIRLDSLTLDMINSWLTESLVTDSSFFSLAHSNSTVLDQCWIHSLQNFRIHFCGFVELWTLNLEFAEFVDFEISPTNPVHNSQQNQILEIGRAMPSHSIPVISVRWHFGNLHFLMPAKIRLDSPNVAVVAL